MAIDNSDTGKPKVSVIVVTYNQQDTIARTLDSILEQKTDFPVEIEIADDCSTDSTGDICRRYVDNYPDKIRYTRNERNLGVRENYYRALLRCRAEYIADCAGDDFWCDALKLQKQVEILDANPDIGLVHTDWQYIDEATGAISPSDTSGENIPFLKPVSEPGELLEAVFVNKMLIHWCTALYRKDVFLKAEKEDPYPFWNSEITFEDFQLSVVYARDTRIAYIPDITMRYSIGKDTVTHTDNAAKECTFVYSLLKLKRHFAQKYALPEAFMRPIYIRYARFLYSMALINNDLQQLREIDNYYRRNDLPRPLMCVVMSFLAPMPVLGSALMAVKKKRHKAMKKKRAVAMFDFDDNKTLTVATA